VMMAAVRRQEYHPDRNWNTRTEDEGGQSGICTVLDCAVADCRSWSVGDERARQRFVTIRVAELLPLTGCCRGAGIVTRTLLQGERDGYLTIGQNELPTARAKNRFPTLGQV